MRIDIGGGSRTDDDERVGSDERRRVAEAFDELGEREWERMEADVASRVSFELHRRWLRRHDVRGRVLEIGAGPGRFTVELVGSGCRVVVADLSAVQLDLNRQHVMDAGAIDGVERWERADICDLPAAWRGGFDAVVAYGGVANARPGDEVWDWLLDAEEAVCREPGTIEGGSHLLFAAAVAPAEPPMGSAPDRDE